MNLTEQIAAAVQYAEETWAIDVEPVSAGEANGLPWVCVSTGEATPYIVLDTPPRSVPTPVSLGDDLTVGWRADQAPPLIASAAQARAPKGTPIGGEWIDTPEGLRMGLSNETASDPVEAVLGPKGREQSYDQLSADHARAQKQLNPGYDANYTRRFNCSQVAIATEMRARGYNAISNDSPTMDGMFTADIERLFPDSRLTPPGNKEQAYEDMVREGPGARFIVAGARKGGQGHAWNAEVTADGDIREFDFQSPFEYTGPISGGQGLYRDYRDYRVLRVDNSPVLPDVVNESPFGPPPVINFREWEKEAAELAAAADPAPALADLGIDVATAELVDEGDRYLVVPAPDQVIYDDRATYVDKQTGAVTRELPPDSPLAEPALTAAAQARAPKGSSIGGQWIDTPGTILSEIRVNPDAITDPTQIGTTGRTFPTLEDTSPASALKANPNWNESNDYGINCQKAAACYEMRRRGMDVTAAPGKGSNLDTIGLAHYFSPRDVRSERIPMGSSKTGRINKTMTTDFITQKYPIGARGNMSVIWRSGGAHVFNWEIDGAGKVHYMDAQIGQEVTKDARYWAAMNYGSVQRLDDAPMQRGALNAIEGGTP